MSEIDKELAALALCGAFEGGIPTISVTWTYPKL
jgi:hypothetical protein